MENAEFSILMSVVDALNKTYDDEFESAVTGKAVPNDTRFAGVAVMHRALREAIYKAYADADNMHDAIAILDITLKL